MSEIMLLFFVMCVMLSCMGLVLVRAIIGSTIYDRILAANLFGTNSVILIVIIGVMTDRFMLIDIALLYACINFISTIAFTRFFLYEKFRDL